MTSTHNKGNTENTDGQKNKSNVLVVDDDRDIAGYLAAVLTLDGHITEEVYSAEAAIEVLKNKQPDLILTDLMMPGIGGLGLLTYIKQESNLPFIPVVMVTALHDSIDKAAALQAGADDFLNKPVNKAELQARVRSLLRLKHANDSLNNKLKEIDEALQGADQRYSQLQQERDHLAQSTAVNLQRREMTARISAAIWRELDEPLTSAINLAQNGLRDGSMTRDALQKLADDLKRALHITAKLEQLALEAGKGTGPLPKIS